MFEQIENRMVIDSEWGEIEYGVPISDLTEEERYQIECEMADRRWAEREDF